MERIRGELLQGENKSGDAVLSHVQGRTQLKFAAKV